MTLALQSMIKLLGRMFGAKFWDNAVFKCLYLNDDNDLHDDNYDNRCNIEKIIIRSIVLIGWSC